MRITFFFANFEIFYNYGAREVNAKYSCVAQEINLN